MDKSDASGNIARRRTSPLVMTYVVPAAIGLAGVLFGAVSTYVAGASAADNQYRIEVGTLVKGAAPTLADEKTAPVAFAALYALARRKDVEYKRVLMTIGYSSPYGSVREILAEFMDRDTDMQTIRNEPDMIALARGIATVSAAQNVSSVVASAVRRAPVPASRSAALAANVESITTPQPETVTLLAAAIPKSSMPGWIYYGRTGPGLAEPGSCLGGDATLPAIDATVSLCSSRFVRDAPSVNDGKILTAAPAGTNFVVRATRSYVLSKDAQAIWLQVAPAPDPTGN